MNFRQFAIKNVRGNWHQYIAYFLSSVFSVMIFFIYAAFIFHPDVMNGHIYAAKGVRTGMMFCEYIIVIFSFFFILYSMSAFLKSRKKEFGLLSLFGMTKGQMRRMVLYESIATSLLAIGAGIALGALFLKLFLMALSEILALDHPIRFFIPGKALLLTAAGFFVLFLIITLFTLFQVGRSQIIDLLKASKKPKSPPLASMWLVLLSVLCLGAGYYMAYTMTLSNAILYMLPVVGLVVVGTFFLFTQASIIVFRFLQRRKGIYYKQTNLMTIAQLVFKMKDNARILFTVSVMSAVILTASGTFYVFFLASKEQQMDLLPQSISFYEKGLNTHAVLDPDKVRTILKENDVELAYEVKLVGAVAELPVVGRSTDTTTALVVSENDYNDYGQKLHRGRPILAVEPGHAVFVIPYSEVKQPMTEIGKPLPVQVEGGTKELSLTVNSQVSGGAIAYPRSDATELLVVDDAQYQQILQAVPDDKKMVVYGFEMKNWAAQGDTAAKIEALVPEDMKDAFDNRVAMYLATKQSMGLTLFIGLFISVLFFIASGSMIYFKLFTELDEDRDQFRSLNRIGMTLGEIRRTVTMQIAIIFFVPCAVGIVHTMFAMKALGNLLSTSAMQYSLVVVGIYIIMQSLYFFAARRSYLSRIIKSFTS
ncbi:putative ABC transport system permease protein [Paenibacillus cellulosilyticus]|uniref:Putative ABC transport system permease protein n=1 Tax=Paenibacillus cellulosilyticus TaxID=375489 RepID=A0A2V2YGS1_9BACL|nr:ABC transporter permease [Paenibacillus cellulosilyticus]PWV92082.1 putative ABC transport system permease protein [Paenibacillus cellulosilyticus]QKS44193.1 ABC transporter permease [Paenibacillus cellulosilyticus]